MIKLKDNLSMISSICLSKCVYMRMQVEWWLLKYSRLEIIIYCVIIMKNMKGVYWRLIVELMDWLFGNTVVFE